MPYAPQGGGVHIITLDPKQTLSYYNFQSILPFLSLKGSNTLIYIAGLFHALISTAFFTSKNSVVLNFLKLKYLLVISFILLLPACTSNHVPVRTHTIASTTNIQQVLYAQYSEWTSVNYRLGGLSKNGIDCSGLVYLTFLENFGIELPRSTEQQVLSGDIVDDQADLRAGDLVFFKTGIWQRHVGIYLEQKKFLHVSARKGVIISSLDSPYWRKRYWQAVRILDS